MRVKGVVYTLNNDIILSDDGNIDFSIEDENNHQLAIFRDGHFKTNRFDSSERELVDDNNAFSISDNEDNTLLRINGAIEIFKSGRIKTKNFDSDYKPIHITKRLNKSCDLHKSQLRVLDIGNSHSWDCINYLKDLVQASGVDVTDMVFVRLSRGGGSFKSYYDCWHDQDVESGDELTGSIYTLSKEFGNVDVFVNNNKLGSSNITFYGDDGTTFRSLLTDNKFDLITIHQRYIGLEHYDEWEGDGQFGYLSDLLRILQTTQPQAEIGTLMNHAPFGYCGNNLFGTEEFLKNVVWETNKKFMRDYGIKFIVPYGTAQENIRKSQFNTSTHGMNYDISSPIHSGLGLCAYVNACTFFETLIAPRYGVSVLGNSLRISLDGVTLPGYQDAHIPVTNENAYTAQMAAILAVNDMWKVQNPDNVTI